MRPLWIISTNMGASSDIDAYVAGVRASGADVAEVTHIPFSPDLPDVVHDGPVVLYGAVSFIDVAGASGRWRPGVFAGPEVFTYQNWARHYGDMLLNSPDATQLTTVGGFAADARPADEDIFVRPQHDTKSLVGAVWRAGEFRAWCEQASRGDYAGVGAATPIVVGKPFGIDSEWRLFVVDGKVAGASLYRHRGRLLKACGAPQEIMDFARAAIARWDPAKAYVLDVCTSAGNPYIVEAQSFNSAGHYAADIRAVAEAVNRVAVEIWREQRPAPVAGPR